MVLAADVQREIVAHGPFDEPDAVVRVGGARPDRRRADQERALRLEVDHRRGDLGAARTRQDDHLAALVDGGADGGGSAQVDPDDARVHQIPIFGALGPTRPASGPIPAVPSANRRMMMTAITTVTSR